MCNSREDAASTHPHQVSASTYLHMDEERFKTFCIENPALQMIVITNNANFPDHHDVLCLTSQTGHRRATTDLYEAWPEDHRNMHPTDALH